jgi:MFS family permease
MGKDRPSSRAGEKLALLDTARHPSLRLPFAAILVSGTLLGLISSYMAPLLISKGVALALFFSVFPITAFGSRFLLLGTVQAWPRRAMLIFAFAAMGGAFWLLSLNSQTWVVVLIAILFGLGSSLSYPMLNAWVSETFTPEQLATPIAIFNAIFNFGLNLTPFSAGYIISLSSYDTLLRILSAASLMIILALLFTRRSQDSTA